MANNGKYLKYWPSPSLFFHLDTCVLFKLFSMIGRCVKHCTLLKDSNSNCKSRRRARWPLDHDQGHQEKILKELITSGMGNDGLSLFSSCLRWQAWRQACWRGPIMWRTGSSCCPAGPRWRLWGVRSPCKTFLASYKGSLTLVRFMQ